MSRTETPEANLRIIQEQIASATKEFNSLKMRRGEFFRDFEYRTKEVSDKLLSLKLAEQLQQQQIEQEAREAELQLKKKPC